MTICNQCRGAGEKLFLKGTKCHTPQCPFTRRPYKPGQTGPGKNKTGGRSDRMSEFGRQLFAKQRIKETYQLRERQLQRFYGTAIKSPDQTGQKVLELLERRLDSVVCIARFAPSRRAARQAISHGRVLVNNKRVRVGSFITRPKDVVQYSKLSTQEEWEAKDLVPWLTVSGDWTITVERCPMREEISPMLDEQSLVEYYSR